MMSLPRVPRSRPRPKLRSIPRRKTESALYAEMQQLTVEKQRLNQELEAIQERRGQIHARLQEIDQAMQQLRQDAETFVTTAGGDPVSPSEPRQRKSPLSQFSPMTIDY